LEDKQLETIIGLFAGMQTALVHLCKTLENKGVATSAELQQSFEATANALPEDLANRQLAQVVLRQIAAGLASPMSAPPEDGIRKALH
jgi:hypothetical protein